MKFKTLLVIAIAAALPLQSAPAQGFPNPLQYMDSEIKKFYEILGERDPKDPQSVKSTRQKLRVELYSVFDKGRISALALGREMRTFSDDQFARFSDQFANLLFLTYLEKIESYNGEKFTFDSFTDPDNSKTIVTGRVVTSSNEIPFEYHLFLENGVWKLFNIKVEGISLIQNYRTQFREYLINHSPDELTERVKEKADELDKSINQKLLNQ